MKYVILLNFLAAPRKTFLIRNKIDTHTHTHTHTETVPFCYFYID